MNVIKLHDFHCRSFQWGFFSFFFIEMSKKYQIYMNNQNDKNFNPFLRDIKKTFCDKTISTANISVHLFALLCLKKATFRTTNIYLEPHDIIFDDFHASC